MQVLISVAAVASLGASVRQFERDSRRFTLIVTMPETALEIQPMAEVAESANANAPAELRRTCGQTWCIVVALIAAGVVFRVQLLDAFFLDFDESMHYQAARQSTVAETWEASRIHTHPPLVFLFYRYWLSFGDSEVMLRMPAVIFSVTALLMGFLWLRELLDTRSAVAGLAFLVFSMPMIHLGAQMRGYTLLLTFVMSSLYLQERFVRTNSSLAMIGSGTCLVLAMLTHYCSAWLILVSGILMSLRVFSGTLPRKSVLVWATVQVVLLCACLALYFGHVRGFVDSQARTELWDFWLKDSAFDPATTHPLQLVFMRAAEFLAFVAGTWWQALVVALLIGTGVLIRTGAKSSDSKWVAFERAAIVLLPFAIAMVLFHLRIYPLGHTRHSMWLMPFVTAGLAAACGPLLNRPTAVWRTAFVVGCGLWVSSNAYPSVWKLKTTQTPEMARKTVEMIRKTIKPDELILTDDSTRNVLEYYLAEEPLRGKPLDGGYHEYRMAGYRIVTIPKFHFNMYDIKSDWPNFHSALKHDATQPMWVAYWGFEVKDNHPKQIYRRFPPGKMYKRVFYKDNQLIHVQFKLPTEAARNANDSRTTPAKLGPTSTKL